MLRRLLEVLRDFTMIFAGLLTLFICGLLEIPAYILFNASPVGAFSDFVLKHVDFDD